jgi:hypothetical protein
VGAVRSCAGARRLFCSLFNCTGGVKHVSVEYEGGTRLRIDSPVLRRSRAMTSTDCPGGYTGGGFEQCEVKKWRAGLYAESRLCRCA